MPLVSVRKQGKLFRLVENGTGRIAKTEANKVARDGGGHRGKATAMRQAEYINTALKRKGY